MPMTANYLNRISAFLLVFILAFPAAGAQSGMSRVQLAADGEGFQLSGSKQPFIPWGFNYSTSRRLIEDIWLDQWPIVERDFAEMKRLGANVVRVHFQFSRFMDGPDRLNEQSLRQLGRLLDLAQRNGLRLDITGLGCFRKQDVPKWYDALDEPKRWEAQGNFWTAIARRCAGSSAVFCYDLMNEPLAPGGRRTDGDWYAGKLGPFYFLQFISLDQKDRPRDQIARLWIRTLAEAIRKEDHNHLITVGLLPSTPQLGHLSFFVPQTIAPELDFTSVHIYPEKAKVSEALATLKQFKIKGKPLIVEETFPLSCSTAELKQFILSSRPTACGWIGHYEGESIQTLERQQRLQKLDVGQTLMLDWLRLFKEMGPQMRGKN